MGLVVSGFVSDCAVEDCWGGSVGGMIVGTGGITGVRGTGGVRTTGCRVDDSSVSLPERVITADLER